MTRFREEYYDKEKKKAKTRRSASARSDRDRARAVRSEYFKKPLAVRKAIAKATQTRLGGL